MLLIPDQSKVIENKNYRSGKKNSTGSVIYIFQRFRCYHHFQL